MTDRLGVNVQALPRSAPRRRRSSTPRQETHPVRNASDVPTGGTKASFSFGPFPPLPPCSISLVVKAPGVLALRADRARNGTRDNQRDKGNYKIISPLTTRKFVKQGACGPDTILGMGDTIGTRARQRRRDLGLSQSEVARRIGVKPQSIQQLEAGKIAKPRYILDLASVLQVSPDWLSHGRSGKPPIDRNGTPGVGFQSAPVSLPATQEMPRDVPVLGTAAGGSTGAFQLSEAVVDYVRRPPGLAGAVDVYAIYVAGDSMSPEHKDGELRFVHPHRPIRPGDSVIIQIRSDPHEPPQAYLKRLLRRTSDRLLVEQLNPRNVVEFESSSVVALHKVLTLNELFGI